MKYLVNYSGFMGANPISASVEVESISLTGCMQNITKKVRDLKDKKEELTKKLKTMANEPK